MNIAFPVLILTLALLPGFLFRYVMLRGTFRRSPVTAQQVAGDLGWLTLSSAVLHVAVGTALHYVGFAPSFSALLILIVGNYGKDGAFLVNIAEELTARPWPYLLYFALTCGVGALAGLVAHTWLRRRPQGFNDWYDLLDADANAETIGNERLPADVYVTAVVDLKIKDQPVLIRGLVDDWFLTPTGDLDSIILTSAVRRPLTGEPPTGDPAGDLDRYYSIRGDYFVLRRSEMITLNVIYLYNAPADTVTDSPSATPDRSEGEDTSADERLSVPHPTQA